MAGHSVTPIEMWIVIVTAPEGKSKEDYCSATQAPALTYQAHGAPIAMIFYRGSQLPADYRGDAFVAMHGSWNRKVPSGYNVVRVRFKNGRPVQFEEFLTGFLARDGESYIGRPAGLAMAADGAPPIDNSTLGYIVMEGPHKEDNLWRRILDKARRSGWKRPYRHIPSSPKT